MAGVAAAGLAGREDANPRDLSGGERQRLALEVVLGGDPPEAGQAASVPAVVLLDEPTRGMDRIHKDALAARIGQLAEAGAAVMVATHDTEFAASLANRIVLLGQGVVIADGPPRRCSAAAGISRPRWPASQTERHCCQRRARSSCASSACPQCPVRSARARGRRPAAVRP